MSHSFNQATIANWQAFAEVCAALGFRVRVTGGAMEHTHEFSGTREEFTIARTFAKDSLVSEK